MSRALEKCRGIFEKSLREVHNDASIVVAKPPAFTTESKRGRSISMAALAYVATTTRRYHPELIYQFGYATLVSKAVYTSRDDFRRQRVGARGQTPVPLRYGHVHEPHGYRYTDPHKHACI